MQVDTNSPLEMEVMRLMRSLKKYDSWTRCTVAIQLKELCPNDNVDVNNTHGTDLSKRRDDYGLMGIHPRTFL